MKDEAGASFSERRGSVDLLVARRDCDLALGQAPRLVGQLVAGAQVALLGADAEFDGVLFDGAAWGAGAEVGSEEEQEYLGIPGLLDADQVTTLLRARQADQVAAQKKTRAAQKMREENAGIPAHKLRAAKRKELQHLVSTWSRRSGETHATIHSRLRSRCGGPEVAQATTEQIEARIALLREWFVGRH